MVINITRNGFENQRGNALVARHKAANIGSADVDWRHFQPPQGGRIRQ
jgi:hypothetical protein